MFVVLLTLLELEAGVVTESTHPVATVIEQAETWSALRFTGANDASRSTSDSFVLKATMKWPCEGMGCWVQDDWRLLFTLQLEARDGRFRVTVSDPQLSWPPSQQAAAYTGPIRKAKDQDAAAKALTTVVDDLVKHVNRTPTEDW